MKACLIIGLSLLLVMPFESRTNRAHLADRVDAIFRAAIGVGVQDGAYLDFNDTGADGQARAIRPGFVSGTPRHATANIAFEASRRLAPSIQAEEQTDSISRSLKISLAFAQQILPLPRSRGRPSLRSAAEISGADFSTEWSGASDRRRPHKQSRGQDSLLNYAQ